MSLSLSKRPRIPLEDLEKSIVERIFSSVSILLFIASSIFLAVNWSILSDSVPVHFDGSGDATSYGSKWTLVVLMLVAIILYIAMHLLEKYPHLHNYPMEITETNAQAAYRISRSLLSTLKNVILIIFSVIMLNSIFISLGWGEGLGILLLPIILVGTLVPVFTAIVKLLRIQ